MADIISGCEDVAQIATLTQKIIKRSTFAYYKRIGVYKGAL